jgi:hypothetical protein
LRRTGGGLSRVRVEGRRKSPRRGPKVKDERSTESEESQVRPSQGQGPEGRSGQVVQEERRRLREEEVRKERVKRRGGLGLGVRGWICLYTGLMHSVKYCPSQPKRGRQSAGIYKPFYYMIIQWGGCLGPHTVLASYCSCVQPRGIYLGFLGTSTCSHAWSVKIGTHHFEHGWLLWAGTRGP